MTTPTSAHSHSVGNTVTSVTPVNLFALLFEILIFILVVLSIVAAVRRYFGIRIGTQTRAQVVLVDLEAQAGQGDASVKNSSGSRWLSSLRGQLLSSSRDDQCLSDTTALLEKDVSKSLPLPGSSACSSSSGVSFLHKLFGRFRRLPPTGVKSDAQPGSTDSPDRVRPHMRALRDQLTREWVNTIPCVGGSHHRFPRETVKPKLASIEIPTIIVTSPEDITTSESPEAEAYSPATTYSEPDSPAIATPRFDSSVDLDVRVVGGEVDQLQIPFPSWGPASDEEETVNLSNFSGELFQLGTPPSRKTATAPALDSATVQLDLSSVELHEDTYPHLLFAIAEEEEPEELETSTAGTVTPQLDSAGPITAMETSAPQSSITPSPSLEDVHPNVSLAITEEEAKTPRIIDACGRLDPAPVHEFLYKGPAIVTSGVNEPIGEASSDDEEEDWEKAFRLGGRLTGAFSSPLSNDSLGDDDYDDDEYEFSEGAYEVLHKTTSACEVQVHGAHKLISLSARIEWCDVASSEASSSDASSDAGSDYQDASSDDESNSSFYSCSESSTTEDDTAVDNSFSNPKVHSARPSAFSILEGYFLPQCDAVA